MLQNEFWGDRAIAKPSSFIFHIIKLKKKLHEQQCPQAIEFVKCVYQQFWQTLKQIANAKIIRMLWCYTIEPWMTATYCNSDAHANIPAVCTHALYTDCELCTNCYCRLSWCFNKKEYVLKNNNDLFTEICIRGLKINIVKIWQNFVFWCYIFGPNLQGILYLFWGSAGSWFHIF